MTDRYRRPTYHQDGRGIRRVQRTLAPPPREAGSAAVRVATPNARSAPAYQKGLPSRGTKTVCLSFYCPTRHPVFTQSFTAHKEQEGKVSDKGTRRVRGPTLLLQHLVSIPDLDVFWKPDCPAEQYLNDSPLNSVRGPGPKVLKRGGTRITEAGRDAAESEPTLAGRGGCSLPEKRAVGWGGRWGARQIQSPPYGDQPRGSSGFQGVNHQNSTLYNGLF